MGYIVSFYSKAAFKEYILPPESNADHCITLRSNYFQIHDDIQVIMEVLDDVWSIKKSRQYSIAQDNLKSDCIELKNQSVILMNSVYDEEIYIFVRSVETPLHAFSKYTLAGISSITIGKDSENDICYDFQNTVSRKHATIQRNSDGFMIKNFGQNGIYVDSALVMDEVQLEFGEYINILGLHIVYLGDALAIDTTDSAVTINNNKLKLLSYLNEATVFLGDRDKRKVSDNSTYHRAPRNYEKLDTGTIEIEAPPALEQEKKKSIFMSIGPSISMALPMLLGCLLMIYANTKSGGGSSLYMYSGLVMSVSSASVGVIWTLLNQRQAKKEREESKKHRFDAYREYLIEKVDEIENDYQDTTRRLEETYPSAKECMNYDENRGILWNRNYVHDDFLAQRLGIGEKSFQYTIDVPKKKFTLYKDELSEKPQFIKDNYCKLIDVPITVDLKKERLIGVVGGKKKKGALEIVQLLVTQITANNCYTDVKLAFIYDNESSDDNGKWDYAKWFPHVWSEDRRVRYIASNKKEASEVLYELVKVFRARLERQAGNYSKTIYKPYYVVFVSKADLLEGEIFTKYAFDKDENIGLTTIVLSDSCENLPNECEFIIENSDAFKGMYYVFDSKKDRQEIHFDEMDVISLNSFARHLSTLHVEESEQGGEIPNNITFFEMMGIHRIEEYPVREMWVKNKTYENIRGLLGQKAGGAPCYLDIHEKFHGPHGLIAGTTGSGKSETLQTYILSLAVNYSPDDVGFFIIDYKGGGMANLFEGLPHLIGSISNLSGNQVKRAMISIKSENRRRQRVFTENGVNNINLYTKLYKSGEAIIPIPHLVIIIDEFAELKREEPEFMKELISVAQVGRSLGVHLILATQKPNGTVDDNIWSNSRFRLCLRVQDQQDSKDMLHKPDAAYITQAGRGYMQVGNDEVYEMFQSGYSGALFDENSTEKNGEIAELITLSGKVDMTGNSVKFSQKKRAEFLWIDMLCRILEQILEKGIGQEGLDSLLNSMYKVFAVQQVDYEDNDFNRARLKEFINLYLITSKVDCETPKAERVIVLANQQGKRLPQQKEKTQLDVTKEHLAKVAKLNGYSYKMSLWMPLLKDHIYLSELEEHSRMCYQDGKWDVSLDELALRIVIGQVDDPKNQSQMPLLFDFFKQGHVAIIGTVASGKSTLMQTMLFGLINHYSPDSVNIYALDFSSRLLCAFENAPHVGGIMYEGDEEIIRKFFHMMENIVKERKELFKGGNYKQFIQRNSVKIPAIVLCVDNYDSFKEKTNQIYEDQMIRLSKEGVNLGIFLIISGAGFGYADITTRVGENLDTVFCLSLADKGEYGQALHNMKIEVMPEIGIKGRGLAYYGSEILEYQAALAVKAENDYQRMEIIQRLCESMRKDWTGNIARNIPLIPDHPTWSLFTEQEDYQRKIRNKDYLPVAYDEADAEVYSIPLRDIYCYLITGESHTGKTNYMKVMLQAAIDKKAQIAVLDGPKGDMKLYSGREKVNYLSNEDDIFEYFKNELTSVFQYRNRIKNDLLQKEFDEIQVYEEMSKEQPYFIFITDFSWFIDMVYKSEHAMAGFMENLITKGQFHNIYFIAEITLNKLSLVRGYRAFEAFTEYHTGVHFGGKVNNNTIMPFEYLTFANQAASDPVGIGTLPGDSSYKGTRKIVVPLARK